MKNMYKILSILIISINYFSISKAQEIPSSFADLAERLMPSVVNISTTTTVTTRSNPLPFEFPPGSQIIMLFKEHQIYSSE